MESLLSALQVRTSIPLGYLLFVVCWLVGMSALAVILFRAIHRRRTASIGFLAALAGFCFGALIFVANIIFLEKLDINPLFSEEDLIGSWAQGASAFDLQSESEITISLEPEMRERLGISNGDGYWEKTGDFEISIGNQRQSQIAMLRVVRYADELRIITQVFADWDRWDGDLGFRKTAN